jgi:flagellar basal-body rod protein FlgG
MAIRALSTAATGMTALQQQIDVISNNLANVNTTGYKRSRANFQDLLYQHLKQVGFAAEGDQRIPTGIQVGLGVKLVSTQKMFAQGALNSTENDLDVAIEGDGFFRMRSPQGANLYTRQGVFHRDGNGNIVDSAGLILEPGLTVPPQCTRINISVDGIVQAYDETDPANPVNLGQILTTRFANPAGLRSVGDSMFVETPASGVALEGVPGIEGRGTLRQGFIEESNVDVVRELVDMISAQRAFEINSQSIQTADQMLQTINRIRG